MFAATNTVANHSPNSLAATNAVAIRLDPFGVHNIFSMLTFWE